VSAPAGYGKTTALTQWAHTSPAPIGWLSLDRSDNDFERFFRYLVLAWEEVQPDVENTPLDELLGSMSPDHEAILPTFINIASKIKEHTALVLNDYHLIEEGSIHHALAFLVDHLPPKLHFVLTSQGEPPLPLTHYRAHRELMEFRPKDLAFRPEETQAFLNEVIGLNLTQAETDRLHAQLEGWIAGLHLVALSLKQRLTGTDELVVTGRHRFIADYLREYVLAPLPEELRLFLLQTSILDRLCGSLCNAITGQAEGQKMLETLERESLFLEPLDDRREWFRYHRLFADFLRETLHRRHPADVADLHRRAGWWHLEQDLPEQAFSHALAGNDVELVNQVFERYWQVKLLSGEIRIVQQWLDSLPEEWQTGYPMIGVTRAGTLLITGQFEACARYLDEIAQWLMPVESADMRAQQARLTAVHCFMACFQNDLEQAVTLADQALQGLPDMDVDLRAGVYGALGDTYRGNGRWQEAQDCYLKALGLKQARTFHVQSAHIFGALADLELRQGHLRDAGHYWQQALAAIRNRENWGRLLPLPAVGWMYIRQGELRYEWNELAEAWDYLSRGLERAESGGDVRAMIAGYLLAVRLKLSADEFREAEEYLERARPHVESAQFAHWTSRFERLQLEHWLAQGRLQAALHWADEILGDAAIGGRPDSAIAQLTMAHVLIAKGDPLSIEKALSRLEQLLQEAETEGRLGIRVEGLTLQALGHWRRSDLSNALTALERALRLAEPEGYLRSFVDYGLPLARLLQEARSRAVMPDYVDKLLAAYETDLTSLAQTKQVLPEPLTPREQEILQLLAAGLTNREIAKQLVIAPGTVKKHTGRIYGKLNVHSRTGAVARARELDLLD
jgi:LuxR family maltose regulon positive regulatory protein